MQHDEMQHDAIFPTVEDICWWHEEQIDLFGGANGIRDIPLLESAAAAPRFAAFYEHASVAQQAAILLYALCKNHPFHDGNKRTALVSSLALCALRGYELDDNVSNERLTELVLAVASGMTSREELAYFFDRHLISSL